MRKKIAIITYSLCGGGAERTVANLLRYLDKNKYEIHLVLMNSDIDYEIPENQVIHYIEKSNRFESEWRKLVKLPMLAYRFAKYCKANEIEMVFSVMNRPNMVTTMARFFGLKAQLLISERFYTPYFYNNASMAGRFKTWLLKRCYSKADCILPNSEGTRDALENMFHINTAYQVIKNPTNIEAIRKMRFEEVADKVDFNKFSFINVAAFREEKNHELLIDAVADIRNRDFQLLLIGKGILLNAMKEKVARLGLQHKILFLPFADNPFKYLQRSSCFITSSLTEGFPNILIESMICGLPVIAADCKTGPRELLAPDTAINKVIPAGEMEIAKYGVLCAINSKASLVAAMNWALDNPEQLQSYKEKGLEKAGDYDYNKVIEEVSKTFDHYLAKK